MSIMMSKLENVLLDEQPDAFLVLGDTNSSLGAIVAARMGINVFHMEAGNRCYLNTPEEINRRLIDSCSDILLPYTERSRQNLISEGVHGQRIFVTGNPIYEVLSKFSKQIKSSDIMDRLELDEGKFFLVTLHRAENLDNPERLKQFINGLNFTAQRYEMPIILSAHPRLQPHLDNHPFHEGIVATKPLGFFDFVHLEQKAYCVLTDSGTVQEECAIFGVPVVTLRDATERPETIEVGSNFIAGKNPVDLLRGIEVARSGHGRTPAEYMVPNVSDTVVKIVLSNV